MKVAVSFLSKDRTTLSIRSIEPLWQANKFDLFWIDGSSTENGQQYFDRLPGNDIKRYGNIVGGAGNALVFALTTMLAHLNNYEFVGLCENDTLLPSDWFKPTMALFDQGKKDGLNVGAVSARCYEDRVLIQRDGYAVCHNLGAGHVIFTREAAKLVLRTFRSAWTDDNRRIFQRVSGIDIGGYWAFRSNNHYLTADWHWEAVLAAHGLAALALTPSHVEMIGQDPPLEQQGLSIVKQPLEGRRYEGAFAKYRDSLSRLYQGSIDLGIDTLLHTDHDTGLQTIFAHQIGLIGGYYTGDWNCRDLRRIGPFTFVANDEGAAIQIPLTGVCNFLISGGEQGGKIKIEDPYTGFEIEPSLQPEPVEGGLLQVNIPGSFAARTVKLTALNKGVCFYGVQSREPQTRYSHASFDYLNIQKV